LAYRYFIAMLGAEEGPVVLSRPLRIIEQGPPVRAGGRAAAGFTLIELLTAIVLLGILMRLAMPSFVVWMNNTKVRTVAEALQTGIRLAQAEAVRGNRQVVLSFTNGTPTLNVTAVANGSNWSIQTVPLFANSLDADTQATFVQGGALGDVASGVTITSTPPSVTALCFNSNGRLVVNTAPGPTGASCAAASASFTIDRTGADRPLRVIVGVGGQLRVCDPNRPTLSATSPDGCP